MTTSSPVTLSKNLVPLMTSGFNDDDGDDDDEDDGDDEELVEVVEEECIALTPQNVDDDETTTTRRNKSSVRKKKILLAPRVIEDIDFMMGWIKTFVVKVVAKMMSCCTVFYFCGIGNSKWQRHFAFGHHRS